jgi:hypothetical protein
MNAVVIHEISEHERELYKKLEEANQVIAAANERTIVTLQETIIAQREAIAGLKLALSK